MAIHHDYTGREQDDPGRWHNFKSDQDTGVMACVRFRRMGRDRARALDDKYRKPISREVKKKMVERMEISTEDGIDMMMEAMDWCWLDVCDFNVAVHSKETLAIFAQELDDPSLVLEQDVCLDGKLTSRLRRWCMDEVPGLTNLMMSLWKHALDHVDVDDGVLHEERREEALKRNLSSGSTSPSATERSPTAAPGALDAAPSAEAKESPVSQRVS